jgi:streptogramin lyase
MPWHLRVVVVMRSALSVALVAALALVATGCGGSDTTTKATPTRATLWVARSSENEIVKLDSEGNVLARIDACCSPRAVAAGAGAVWFTTDTGMVLRVDPATDRLAASIPVGTRPGVITTGGDAVWVADADAHQLVRVDPVTNAVAARVALGSEQECPSWLAADAASVWVVLYMLGVVRIDAATDSIAAQSSTSSQTTSCRPASLALAGDRVWVLDALTGALLALDPESLATISSSELGAGIWEIAGDGRNLWALEQTGGDLVRLDARDGSITQRVETGARKARHLVLGMGSVWFYDGEAIVRVSETGGKTQARIEASTVNGFTVTGV